MASGVIQEINVDKFGENNPFAKAVPQPAKPDDSKYLASLVGYEKDMHNLYEEL